MRSISFSMFKLNYSLTCRIVDIKNYRFYVFPCVLLFSINFVKTKTTMDVIEESKELCDKIHSLAELVPYLSKRNIANNIILHQTFRKSVNIMVHARS